MFVSRHSEKIAKAAKLAALALLVLATPHVHASTTETREYVVLVDGNETKRFHLSIVVNEDESMTLSSWITSRIDDSNTLASVISAKESWKSNRLQSLTANAHGNTKNADLSAVAEGNRMRVRVNGRERLLNSELWTSNYWKLADAKFHNKSVPVLDVDSGKDFSGYLQYVGTVDLKVASQAVRCYHVRIVGGPAPVNVWFDVHHLMVRQEFVEGGRRTVVQLAGIQR